MLHNRIVYLFASETKILEHRSEDDYVAEEDNYSRTLLRGGLRYAIPMPGMNPTRRIGRMKFEKPKLGEAGAEWKRKKKERWKRELLLFGQERL